ncbi:hypothetical protein MY11210_008306 [Beauveria gryllotalpidicola]
MGFTAFPVRPGSHSNHSNPATGMDGDGVGTELTKNGTIRQKRWTTRARTGCLTCRFVFIYRLALVCCPKSSFANAEALVFPAALVTLRRGQTNMSSLYRRAPRVSRLQP